MPAAEPHPGAPKDFRSTQKGIPRTCEVVHHFCQCWRELEEWKKLAQRAGLSLSPKVYSR